MMPLPTGGRNALRTISARLEIVYFYRMRIYQRLTTKEMLRRGIISVLLKAISGRHELSIFMLIPPNKDFAAYSDMRWKNGG